ncbi:MAG: dihydroxyacetone kinase subunit DhaL [Hyphomicrobiales bacterium]
MNVIIKQQLIESVAKKLIEHADELTALDQAVGDGDHGLNMKRGFEAILADCEAHAAKPFPDMLKGIGTQLVMKVGGASGPLYGTLFMAFAKEISDPPTLDGACKALGAAIEAVKARGKSEPGQKTMLDVLVPVHAEWSSGGINLGKRLLNKAKLASEDTIPMKAVRGRASFLGDRSIGHKDPGARSSQLMIEAIVQVLGAS